MSKASSIGEPAPKRVKIRAPQRRERILALQLAGKTQEQIASDLGVHRSTIVRDLQRIRPSQEAVDELLTSAQKRLRETFPVEQRIDNYVELVKISKETKQPSAGGAILQRLDDIDGLITDKERLRAKADQPAQSQPMFMLPPGASVSVTVTTTSSNKDALTERVENAIDVTPKESA